MAGEEPELGVGNLTAKHRVGPVPKPVEGEAAGNPRLLSDANPIQRLIESPLQGPHIEARVVKKAIKQKAILSMRICRGVRD